MEEKETTKGSRSYNDFVKLIFGTENIIGSYKDKNGESWCQIALDETTYFNRKTELIHNIPHSSRLCIYLPTKTKTDKDYLVDVLSFISDEPTKKTSTEIYNTYFAAKDKEEKPHFVAVEIPKSSIVGEPFEEKGVNYYNVRTPDGYIFARKTSSFKEARPDAYIIYLPESYTVTMRKATAQEDNSYNIEMRKLTAQELKNVMNSGKSFHGKIK